MKFLVINGPNLNLLGQREPGIYGGETYDDLCRLINDHAAKRGARVHCFQSNHEGAIIDAIHDAQGIYDAIIINPGAYTHYSYAILDALKAVTVPAYEVHISHIDQREPFRAISVTAPACVGQIYGEGFPGYLRAMDYFLDKEQEKEKPAASAGGKLCVIGDPVGHSKSPLIQNAMLRALGLEPCYGAVEVKRGELPQWLERARAEGYLGFNATMPHKEDLLPLMDGLDRAAKACGAVNTVVLRDGEAYGASTDGAGLMAALRERGFGPSGKTVLMLGAGGAAKSVANALAETGARTVYICNRHPQRAKELSRDFPSVLFPADFAPETLYHLAAEAQLVINCTSVGMGNTQFKDLSWVARLPEKCMVCDLVYEPAETGLLRHARERGLATMNGLGMLVHQAVLALELMLDRELDRETMAKVAWDALNGASGPS